MKKEELKTLFQKYAAGTATEEERALLEAWYLQHNEAAPSGLPASKIEAVKRELFRRLPGNQGEFFKIGARLAGAAVIIGILLTVTLHYVARRQPHGATQLVNDLPPGTNKAVLALASGQKINLSDAANGRLLQRRGISIVKSKAGQVRFEYAGTTAVAEQNTISTPNGGQWQIRLPDGSQVWLNAASSLTFPTTFNDVDKRIVKLHGEAYFEVAKDAAHPFIVISGDQSVEVLGTHFNINSYNDEPEVKTTLLEGSVKVCIKGNHRPSILQPGQQSISDHQQLRVKSADTDAVLAWKNGYFQFDDESINSIMRKLSRWYDVQVDYAGSLPATGINGRISRNKNISQVIKALEATQTVHFKMEGRRITVMK